MVTFFLFFCIDVYLFYSGMSQLFVTCSKLAMLLLIIYFCVIITSNVESALVVSCIQELSARI